MLSGFPGFLSPNQKEEADERCEDLGHIFGNDPTYCLDCKNVIPSGNRHEGMGKKDKKDKKATITKGASTPAASKPAPKPRVYKDLAEFVDRIPVAPPVDVRPKDPVGKKGSSTTTSWNNFEDYMGYF